MVEQEETEEQRFVREFIERVSLYPRLRELTGQIDREHEVLTTLWVPEPKGD